MVGICIFISVIFLCLNEQRFLAILEEKFEDTKGEIEGQAMQWPNEKGQKDKHRSTKHYREQHEPY